MQGKINRGRHTDHLAGCHSIRTNQCPPPPSLHFFTGQMPFLSPNQQCQSTEACHLHDNNNNNNDDDDKNNVNVNCAVIMNIAIERSLGSFDKCSLSTGWVPTLAATIHTHCCHLLLLLGLKADTHFTITWRVEG